MPTEVTVIDTRRIPSPDPTRMGKFDRMLVVEIAGGVRDHIRVPDETCNEATVKAAIEAWLKERGVWTGKKFTV